MTSGFMSGTITSTTPYVVAMSGAQIPCAITLNTAYASKKIEFSTNGGVEYYTATPTITTSTSIMYVATYPITHVRFTGQNGDTFYVV